MPEQSKVECVQSKYQGEKDVDKKYVKLGKKITDVVKHKIIGFDSTQPEYWGLKEKITPEMCDLLQPLKLRKYYTLDQLIKIHKNVEPTHLKDMFEKMAYIGIVEYDYGDNYSETGEIKDKPKIKRYRIPFFVPGSAELFNSSIDRIEENPTVTSFFERMTFIPLAGITQMVPQGGDGIGMHVIPVEKAIEHENKSLSVEHISHWLDKYDGHISAGICSCRASRAVLDEGIGDDVNDWCIQVGDMADYTVETNRAHYITKERALEIINLAEKNGFVHQITNIDGENKIFDICNCNVKICNALRTSLLFNTPNLSRSAYTAKVDKTKCVACGKCVESCPAGAVKLGQKLCDKYNLEVKYPQAPLPDNNLWGKYAWDENYRDTARMSNTYDSGSAPCKAACPAHVPVQGYINLVKQGKYKEALALIKTENPFPAVCGRVCNKRCEMQCTRGMIDAPVSIDEIKKFVADLDLNSEEKYLPEIVSPKVNGHYDDKIAIIGSGPAGLSAAYYLCTMGYKPVVFEKDKLPGGMMRYGIPSYKLEKDILDKEIETIKQLGTDIRCGVEVGKDITIQQLRDQGFKAFYIAIGLQGGKLPGIENQDAKNIDIAVSYLHNSFEKKEDFKGEVVVIGGGNVAIDCARNATRLKASKVSIYCLESKEEMPANDNEVMESIEEKISINNGWGVKKINVTSKNAVTSIVLKKCTQTIDPETKKFNPLYDENETIEVKADKVIFAIGQDVLLKDLLKDSNVKFNGNYPIADPLTYQSDEKDIFVGGDFYKGARFVIDAIAQGHEVTQSIHRYVQNGDRADLKVARDRRNYTPLDKSDITLPSYDKNGRQIPSLDENIDFKTSFKDAHITFSEEQAKTEANRCLGCGVSIVDPHKCIGCGICTTKCQFDAISLIRDHPKASKMLAGEQKISHILTYSIKRSFKIMAHRLTKEGRMMAKKRRLYKVANKHNKKLNPYTGNTNA